MSVEQLQQEDNKQMLPVYLEIVQRNSARIGDLITELLKSSRPSELQFERTSLQGVMDEAITGALDRITLQRINMKIRYSDDPAWINADKQKLRMAFLNIIINALEAMENRKGELDISVEYDPSQHNVIIRDTGVGIPEENITRLFEPYFTSKRNGMGLGLASTLNILQSHKANIDVQSTLNKGTAFTNLLSCISKLKWFPGEQTINLTVIFHFRLPRTFLLFQLRSAYQNKQTFCWNCYSNSTRSP